ncbi:MAG TPA: hypothetical protein VF805_10110, partial [Anaeromyxobacteraceae bacterium]
DLIDVPEQARKELDFVFASSMEDVLKAALEENPIGRKPPAPPPTAAPPPTTDADGKKPEVRA